MPIPFEFDFKNPDYKEVINYRLDRLENIRKNPSELPAIKQFYKQNPAQFILDWGVTTDPRNPERGLPSAVPFLLFEKQEEWINWVVERWKNQQGGLTDKSRDMGVSCLSISLAVTLCLFHDNLVLGFGSRKEKYIDSIGDPGSLFYKVREFIKAIPVEFRGGWEESKHANYMKISFPSSGSKIVGDTGSEMGRGHRFSIFFLDESAFIPHAKRVDAALSQSTNCRIDMSTPCGMSNPFAERRWSGKVPVLTMHWRDHPHKDDEWYERECNKINDPVIIAQEIDLNYSASVEGIVIPSEWVQSAIDAHQNLGIEPTGRVFTSLDVADQGRDLNAMASRHGILLDFIESWSGKGSDILGTVQRAFNICDERSYKEIRYDADGLGAGCRGDSRIINETRQEKDNINFVPFRGSGAVVNKKGDPYGNVSGVTKGRTNEDYFANYKAQAWWALRRRFQLTHRAVKDGAEYLADDIISISSGICDRNGKNLLSSLVSELSQPTFSSNNAGKILIDKAPDGSKSPNLADAVMMAFAPIKSGGFFNA